MGRHKYHDIEIRGVVYPTVQAAAAALGVTTGPIYAAIRNGTLHRVGTGKVGIEPMPVRIRGVVYADARAAAAALGVALATVRAAVSKGNPDSVGRKPSGALWRSRPITIGPLTFPSLREAGRQLGFANPDYVRHAMRTGSRKGWQNVLSAAMRLAAARDGQTVCASRTERAAGAVTIGQLTFASQAEAARQLGCTAQHVRFALDGISARMLADLEIRAARRAAGDQIDQQEDAMAVHLSWAERDIMKRIVADVAARRGLSVTDIMGRRTHRYVAYPRQEAMALASREGLPDDKVARFFHRDRTTVIHARRAHAEREAAREGTQAA